MAAHSSTLAWKILRTEEPGGPQSVRLQVKVKVKLLSRVRLLQPQTVERLSTKREAWVRSLGREDPLEKEMATHSSTLAWRIPSNSINCFKKISSDFPGAPVVKISPSNAMGVGSIPGQGAKIPHVSRPKTQNIKQKQYCNKFNKDF